MLLGSLHRPIQAPIEAVKQRDGKRPEPAKNNDSAGMPPTEGKKEHQKPVEGR